MCHFARRSRRANSFDCASSRRITANSRWCARESSTVVSERSHRRGRRYRGRRHHFALLLPPLRRFSFYFRCCLSSSSSSSCSAFNVDAVDFTSSIASFIPFTHRSTASLVFSTSLFRNSSFRYLLVFVFVFVIVLSLPSFPPIVIAVD